MLCGNSHEPLAQDLHAVILALLTLFRRDAFLKHGLGRLEVIQHIDNAAGSDAAGSGS